MDPTRNPAEDQDFNFDAWVRWQTLKNAWVGVQETRLRAARPQPAPAPEPPFEPEIVYLLPVPN
ncbi:hypothetical protein E5K00_15790 [Hymenobacter aquaticus]|uniref:Uncharacterized protein n=1 Tax=Hymenobacter aquaticus TaxID=1867101 RepID=A0A4Z0PXU6_9BACT|nr:hypothetical protein [Hymenobacter aquaticus]TGE21733.1 hypothetical protein E5K00_15790 [Hymenobacter aquaticus]